MSGSPLLDRIRAATGETRVSLPRLAAAAGVHPHTLQHWAYRDRCPHRRTQEAVASVLGVGPDALDPECWARRTTPWRSAGTHTVARGAAHGLVEMRRRLGLTQAAVGEALGCDASTVGGWEQGRTRPGAERLARLAVLYRVDAAAVIAALAPRAYAPIDGDRLRDWRVSRDMSQAELGRRVGATGSAVSLWEAGRRAPTRIHWARLEAVLGEDAAALVPGDAGPGASGRGAARPATPHPGPRGA